MKIRELSINVSQKVNLGNFQSKGIGLGATVEISEEDNLIECKQHLTDKLNQMLEFEVKRIRQQNGNGAGE